MDPINYRYRPQWIPWSHAISGRHRRRLHRKALCFAQQSAELYQQIASPELPRALNACAPSLHVTVPGDGPRGPGTRDGG